MKIDYIRLAHEDGVGVGKIGDSDVLGEDISEMDFQFSVGDGFASRFREWRGELSGSFTKL